MTAATASAGKPGSVRPATARFRASSPAMTRSTRLTAIWIVTSARPGLHRRPPNDHAAAPPANPPSTLDRVPVHAGIRPAATPAPSATATDSPNTRPFNDRSSATGTSSGARTAPSPLRSPQARATPPAAPSNDSTALSTRSCRTSRARVAPSARRSPFSRRRAAARSNSNPATFAQTISSTSPISTTRLSAPARRRFSIIGWVATSPVGTTVTRNPSFDPGYAASSARITPFRLAAAVPAVSPSRSRPFSNIQR